MSSALSWAKHLFIKRGTKVILQALKMQRLHRTSSEELFANMFEVLDEYDASFTFPLTMRTGVAHPELTKMLRDSRHEVAIHGYKHLRYEFLPREHQEADLREAIKACRRLGIPVRGFRAPYNRYNEDTKELLAKYHFRWDGGVGYLPENRTKQEFFKPDLRNGEESSYTCFPVNRWSDDLMIDYLNYSGATIGRMLERQIGKVVPTGGLVTFDLHPIRIGQPEYVVGMAAALDFCRKNDVWAPTVWEGLQYWQKNKRWKGGAKACCLLTGDVDNYTFWDYLKRF